ncbi:MAG: hypothetical protein IPH10_13530 [bacterium]|nr:hypothetical protein [bacterium]
MKISRSVPNLNPHRILMVQLRRIGDCLLCTPAIRALHERFPAATIDFLAEYPGRRNAARTSAAAQGVGGSDGRAWRNN